MDISALFFLSSALFLGWSAGANNAANIFGTAVISKMVKFRTAAITAGIFVVLGSVISGAGTTETLTDLGSVNALAGSFAVAVAVGISIILMIRAKVLVSSSQVILGGIIGWNLFTGSPTDNNALYKILFSWVASPVIAAIFGFILFKIIKNTVLKWKIHLLE
ncbi:MAG TPA: inorganic phosphate transporter, partial [Ignavibacteriaceae bacterium]|nr:inorganic phosphate transporter [Ignavibacteriaceae bacterium]